jgi:hypothetical protein
MVAFWNDKSDLVSAGEGKERVEFYSAGSQDWYWGLVHGGVREKVDPLIIHKDVSALLSSQLLCIHHLLGGLWGESCVSSHCPVVSVIPR